MKDKPTDKRIFIIAVSFLLAGLSAVGCGCFNHGCFPMIQMTFTEAMLSGIFVSLAYFVFKDILEAMLNEE